MSFIYGFYNLELGYIKPYKKVETILYSGPRIGHIPAPALKDVWAIENCYVTLARYIEIIANTADIVDAKTLQK